MAEGDSNDAVGVLLAGGSSSRFEGGDKAFAEIDGKPMLRHVAEALTPVVESTVVSCRGEQRTDFETVLDGLGEVRFAVDPVPYAGPVAAIESSLRYVEKENLFVLACDVPFVRTESLRRLKEILEEEEADAVVPSVDGEPQPLTGFYRAESLRNSVEALDDTYGEAIFAVLDHLRIETVKAGRLPGGSDGFRNVNTPEDIREAREACR